MLWRKRKNAPTPVRVKTFSPAAEVGLKPPNLDKLTKVAVISLKPPTRTNLPDGESAVAQEALATRHELEEEEFDFSSPRIPGCTIIERRQAC